MKVKGLASSISKTISQVPPEAVVVPILSGAHIYDDFKKAEPEQKKKTLARDLTIFSCTTVGAVGAALLTGKAFAKTNMKADIGRVLGLPLGALIGGLTSGVISDKLFPPTPEAIEEHIQKKVDEKLEQLESTPEEQEEQKKINSKKKEHFRNILTATTTTLGALGGSVAAGVILKNKSIKKLPKVLTNIGATLIGGIGGFLLSKPIEANKDKIKPENVDLEVLFTNSYTVVKGINIAQAQAPEERVKKGAYELIAGVVTPTALVLPVAQLIATKKADGSLAKSFKFLDRFEKLNKPDFIENAILLPLTVGGVYMGRLIAGIFEKKVTDKIINQETLERLNTFKKELVHESFFSKDASHQARISNELEKIEKIEESIEEDIEKK